MRGYRYTARLLKAMAHPVRLAILQVLRQDGECCVCHLEHVLGKRQAYISQQLARLRQAGLVVDRREGLNVFYALSGENIAALLDGAAHAAGRHAVEQGTTLDFKLRSPDHSESCPCPNCTTNAEAIDRVQEKAR